MSLQKPQNRLRQEEPLGDEYTVVSYAKAPRKAKMGLKKKPKSVGKLKKELWKYFSLYIRSRDKFTCFICGRKGTGGGMHAGHFIPKSVGGLSLYFHEDNVHACCYHCNINLGGNLYEYGIKLGDKKVKELYALKQCVVKDFPYDSMIEKYKKLCETFS